MAHYCLQELHILPSQYAAMGRSEKAFVVGSCLARQKAIEDSKNKD